MQALKIGGNEYGMCSVVLAVRAQFSSRWKNHTHTRRTNTNTENVCWKSCWVCVCTRSKAPNLYLHKYFRTLLLSVSKFSGFSSIAHLAEIEKKEEAEEEKESTEISLIFCISGFFIYCAGPVVIRRSFLLIPSSSFSFEAVLVLTFVEQKYIYGITTDVYEIRDTKKKNEKEKNPPTGKRGIFLSYAIYFAQSIY